MAMTGFLTFAVLLTWNWLKYPPASGDPATDAKTPAVSAYFERTWVDGEFKPALWSHYNVGPRTTNLAEGWHNDLNSRFGMPHPSLRLFLDWLQKVQHEVQCSWPLVVHRRTLQCTPSWTRTWRRMLQYSVYVGHLFAHVFPGPTVWDYFNSATAAGPS